MASLNRRASAVKDRTHEGAPAASLTKEQQLRRSVLSCLLWEDGFYEDGVSITDRIVTLAEECDYETVSSLAYEARKMMHLRHVPLLLLATLAKKGSGNSAFPFIVRDTLGRADEMAELLSIYWRNGRTPLSNGLKKGLALAFNGFSSYSLAKYQGKADKIGLKDVMAICHPKPASDRKELYASIKAGTLSAPDTWEVNLSAGANKKETFERLISSGALGYMALIRNLRGMKDVQVDDNLIRSAILDRRGAGQVLPFRYLAALNAAPQFAEELNLAMVEAIKDLPALSGKTAVLVDVSGSMDQSLSKKSDLTRMDAAACLASMVRGNHDVFAFSTNVKQVPAWPGLAGVEAIKNSMAHASTNLGVAVVAVLLASKYDRIIVLTDEQSADPVMDPPPGTKGYMINVASEKNGVGGKAWTRIDGFSENILRYVAAIEQEPTVG